MKEEYKEKEDYKRALEIIRDFTKDFLCDNIYYLNGLDLESHFLKHNDRKIRLKYKGREDDPDMFLISQAVYLVVWGYVYDLTFEKLGSWGRKPETQYPYRGDTMNSFCSVYGENNKIANRYSLSGNLMVKINEYRKLYHSIGNFIVIPNQGNVNNRRGNYCSMQDYFDWFVGAYYHYKNPEACSLYSAFSSKILDSMTSVFDANPEYAKMRFDEWIKIFFLDSYVENGRPINVFEIDLRVRIKEYIGRTRRSTTDFYTTEEYEQLAVRYYKKSGQIIEYRGQKICSILEEALKQ